MAKSRLSQEIKDQIKAAISLPELIGRTTPLKRKGPVWVGCCPFHSEKTPSFNVEDDHYHCFGCGAHGDAIKYIQETRRVSFPEAVKSLAEMAGISLPEATPEEAASEVRTKTILDCLNEASKFYQSYLLSPDGEAARLYLVERGVTKEDIEAFNIGLSPAGGGKLLAHLKGKGFSETVMVSAGLARVIEHKGLREFFYQRVMFPIHGRNNHVVSFGGRRYTENDGPKYINGAETSVFKKGRHLYGLEVALKNLRGDKPIIFVEGYLDVIALHRAGFSTAVAPLGTAVTPEHMQLGWRHSNTIISLFDGDKAGLAAAEKMCETAYPLLAPDRAFQLALLDGGADPDSLVVSGPAGIATLAASLEKKITPEMFAFNGARSRLDIADAVSRARFRADVMAVSQRISDNMVAREVALLASKYVEDALTDDLTPAAGVSIMPDGLAQVILGTILSEPELLETSEDIFRALPFAPGGSRLRDCIIEWWTSSVTRKREDLVAAVRNIGLLDGARICADRARAHMAGLAGGGAPPSRRALLNDLLRYALLVSSQSPLSQAPSASADVPLVWPARVPVPTSAAVTH